MFGISVISNPSRGKNIHQLQDEHNLERLANLLLKPLNRLDFDVFWLLQKLQY